MPHGSPPPARASFTGVWPRRSHRPRGAEWSRVWWHACVPPPPSGDAGGLLNKAPRLRFALGPWILSIVLGPADRTRTSSVSGPASSSASAACTAPQVRSERGRAADRSGGEGHAVGGGTLLDAHATAARPGEQANSRGRGGTTSRWGGAQRRAQEGAVVRAVGGGGWRGAECAEAPCLTPRPAGLRTGAQGERPGRPETCDRKRGPQPQHSDIWGQVVLCYGGHPVRCRVLAASLASMHGTPIASSCCDNH